LASDKKKRINPLKEQSSEILIPFFDILYIDRPRPEYEPLLILTISETPTILQQTWLSLRGKVETLSEKKINFSENLF
jgi:hypothetical protein